MACDAIPRRGMNWIRQVPPVGRFGGSLRRFDRSRLGWGAMFATLSGGLRRPGDSLEIEVLFDRAVRGQTTNRFSEPPQIEHDGQDAALQPRGRPSCLGVCPGNPVRTFRVWPPTFVTG